MKKTIVGILVGVLVVLGIVSLLLTFVFNGTQKSVEQATRFVEYIANTDTANAYEQFSPELKNIQDKATFDTAIGNLRLDASCKLVDVSSKSETSLSDGVKKTITGHVQCGARKLDTAQFVYNGNDALIGYDIRP